MLSESLGFPYISLVECGLEFLRDERPRQISCMVCPSSYTSEEMAAVSRIYPTSDSRPPCMILKHTLLFLRIDCVMLPKRFMNTMNTSGATATPLR